MKLTSAQLRSLPDSDFGLPALRMYPIFDKEHLVQAVQFFKDCLIKNRIDLAMNINKRASEFNLQIKVNPDNPYFNYMDRVDEVVKEGSNLSILEVNQKIFKTYQDVFIQSVGQAGHEQSEDMIKSAINIFIKNDINRANNEKYYLKSYDEKNAYIYSDMTSDNDVFLIDVFNSIFDITDMNTITDLANIFKMLYDKKIVYDRILKMYLERKDEPYLIKLFEILQSIYKFNPTQHSFIDKEFLNKIDNNDIFKQYKKFINSQDYFKINNVGTEANSFVNFTPEEMDILERDTTQWLTNRAYNVYHDKGFIKDLSLDKNYRKHDNLRDFSEAIFLSLFDENIIDGYFISAGITNGYYIKIGNSLYGYVTDFRNETNLMIVFVKAHDLNNKDYFLSRSHKNNGVNYEFKTITITDNIILDTIDGQKNISAMWSHYAGQEVGIDMTGTGLEAKDTKWKDSWVSYCCEGLNINGEGDVQYDFSINKSYMDRYAYCHKLLMENIKNKNYEDMKHNAAYMFALVCVIESKYVGKNKNIDKDDEDYKDGIKARSFAINDFKSSLKIIQQKEPKFNFMQFYQDNNYDKNIFTFKHESLVGIKKIFNTILF